MEDPGLSFFGPSSTNQKLQEELPLASCPLGGSLAPTHKFARERGGVKKQIPGVNKKKNTNLTILTMLFM